MDKISLEYLTMENWPRYKSAIMGANQAFPKGGRASVAETVETFTEEGAFGRVLLVDEVIAGTAFGGPIDQEWYAHWEIEKLVSEPRENIVYFSGLWVKSEFRGKGLGKQIFYDIILRSKEKGYTTMLGDFREGASSTLAEYYLAEDLWCYEEDGEDYYFCKIDLKQW